MKASELAQNKWIYFACIIFVGSLGLAYETGKELPYLYTESASTIKLFVVFPLLVLFFIWVTLLHKWSETGLTGYQMALAHVPNRRNRIKLQVGALFGGILISATLPWMLNNYIIWVAEWTASRRFAHTYQVIEIKGVSNAYDVNMMAVPERADVSLRLTKERLAMRDWKEGDLVCAQGRTSIFGTIIETVKRGTSECVPS